MPSTPARRRRPTRPDGPLLASLNPDQRDAVATTQGPLLVLAGAGTGKTRVITTRIAHLMDLGADPSSILAVTFTNKAAAEMRERVTQLAGARAREITVGTFHAFCVRILREHGAALSLPRRFTICDASDQLSAVKSVMRELRVHETTMHPSAVLARISLAKNRMETPETFLANGNGGRDQLVGSVWQRYQEHLARNRALDFDDLLLEAVRLLSRHKKVRDHYRRRYRYVLVDEYQDTNHPQYEIVRQIGGGHRNVCVVGDDDQSIYGWRGADIRKILGFHRDFKGAKVVRLQTNYRSTVPILEAANAVIRHNGSRHEKALESAKGDGDPVRVVRLKDETAEARFTVEEMLEALRRHEARPRDFAILCRTQVQFRTFEAELRAAGIPYVVVGGMSFFDRKEVRDVVAFLKLAVHSRDETALLRVINTPPRGVGKTSLDRVLAFATEHGISAAEAFERAAEIEKLNPQSVEGYRQLTGALEQADLAEAGGDLVFRLRRFLDVIAYRDEVRRLYSDPMTREARWAGVEEVLNFAENYVSRSSKPTLHGFLEELALSSGDETHRDPRDPGRQGHADDPARGQGSGVPPRLPGRHGGRAAAPHPLRRRRRRGGGAAPRLRGHHPGHGHSHDDLGLRAREVRPTRGRDPVALPLRGSGARPPRGLDRRRGAGGGGRQGPSRGRAEGEGPSRSEEGGAAGVSLPALTRRIRPSAHWSCLGNKMNLRPDSPALPREDSTMKRRRALAYVAVAAVLVAGALVPRLLSSRSGDPAGPAAPAASAVTVQVVTVAPQTLTERLSTTGTVRANENVELVAEIAGKVAAIHFREGARVSAGQVLLEIDDTQLAAERERAAFRLSLAERSEERQRRLLDEGLVSQEEYDFALNELNVLKAELALVEARLVKTRIEAPFGGIIGLRAVSVGSYLTPQTRIATLQDVDPVKIDFSIPEKYAGQLGRRRHDALPDPGLGRGSHRHHRGRRAPRGPRDAIPDRSRAESQPRREPVPWRLRRRRDRGAADRGRPRGAEPGRHPRAGREEGVRLRGGRGPSSRRRDRPAHRGAGRGHSGPRARRAGDRHRHPAPATGAPGGDRGRDPMTLYSLSIRRPVLAIVMSMVIVLFGLIGFSQLGVREFPSVDPPVITVSTNYRGANTDVIESQITEPLEDSINGIAGIRTLTSVSREGRSTITVEFELGSDLERAANDVRDRVSRAQYNLPPDVDPPQVAKADADAFPILMLTVYSDTRDLLELSRLADEVFAERLQTIEGVSDIMIWGDRTYAMRLWIDPQRLAAYQLSPMDVRDAVRDENVELPSGRIEGREVELAVRTLGRLNTPEAFENLIVKEEGGRIVRFRDVGRAELGPRNERTVLKADGVPMVAVVLRPLPGANYVAIADEYYRRVAQIQRELPEDIRLNFGFDASQYVRKSVAEVEQTVFVAFVLVILVIFLFLREWRTTFIPVVVIPVALIGSFFVMYLAGFTLNVLTLLGHRPRHRAGGRRRDHRPREHLHEDRGRAAADRGGDRGDPGDLLRGHRHHRGSRLGAAADPLPGRPHR